MSKYPNHAHIEIYFKDYKERFFHYLLPWVVDDLRNDTINIPRRGSNKLFVNTQYSVLEYFNNIEARDVNVNNKIRESVMKYYKYVFPVATFPYIKYGTEETVVAENSGLRTNRSYIFDNTILDYFCFNLIAIVHIFYSIFHI